ncbi:bifunctional UDP-N-acetylglucosamine diphosphorylase/glucosamine-1-phosphate N-acetyltransferase GlmU [Variovorax sp. OV700]|jgi:bifunctional UDP-N-acetylglucosamine pyrophosphorylase/glucosamine-1-phosphate N-acetyltransferase|uniref:bifunctional UDP-N-acetylglucosamine diphosphorylase/glucosamine-1-phosphate N-acetyltransferase GlmU n=1 Tax=Variovorax sp. OV700 TaxID=1882826 RepID=UPI000885C35B|nr:bifunctional UDP-N-acetylglucosamine diphosphorylase/glucosamine-1-phosphate N-acetyltransferase GlmU [Variovorax sp. OV700]SDI89316.1 UDP-N-acetylglucosamine pyrophosphorylase /glucosamine-1-phosphate N-acetyltransferase [Variovorax sp. OV700]
MNQIPQDNQGPIDVVIMAAGKGTRMKSRLPKVLHRLAGRALLAHVTDTAARIGARHVVVVTGHGAAEVEAAMSATGAALQFARQEPQLGTGHAVQQAVPLLPDDGTVLVLSGDVPLIGEETLRALIAASAGQRLALLTIEFDDPTGYGRIVRAEGQGGQGAGEVTAIVEQKDATEAQRQIREIYSGVMAVPVGLLKGWLARLDNRNAQGEYYLTDIVKLAAADGVPVVAHVIGDALQVAGINSPAQLAALERAWQLRQADALMAQGVRLADPARFDVRGTLACEADVEIDVNCVFEGSVYLGEGVRIGANCVIANARIEAGAVIHPFTHIDGEKTGVTVGERSLVGPFARLRPGAQLGTEVHIGNFVEVKNSTLADGAKANHLAYLGDASVGQRVNYGAGSITANYDGANKHRTVIEDDVHVGSNCVLVAPITIGAGGTIGGGSTVNKSTAPGALTVARGKQVSFPNWKRPQKTPKA